MSPSPAVRATFTVTSAAGAFASRTEKVFEPPSLTLEAGRGDDELGFVVINPVHEQVVARNAGSEDAEGGGVIFEIGIFRSARP